MLRPPSRDLPHALCSFEGEVAVRAVSDGKEVGCPVLLLLRRRRLLRSFGVVRVRGVMQQQRQ